MPPSHIALGTQRSSEYCPSTWTRRASLEDRYSFSQVTGFPRAGASHLQRFGIADRYGNMHLLAWNLALVCHGICDGWEEGSCLFYSNKHFFLFLAISPFGKDGLDVLGSSG